MNLRPVLNGLAVQAKSTTNRLWVPGPLVAGNEIGAGGCAGVPLYSAAQPKHCIPMLFDPPAHHRITGEVQLQCDDRHLHGTAPIRDLRLPPPARRRDSRCRGIGRRCGPHAPILSKVSDKSGQVRITRPGRADVYALTGLTMTDVDRIAADTDPGHRRGRPPRLIHRDRVLLTLVAQRTNLTERALAAIFGISQPTAHRTIRDMMSAVADLFVPAQFDITDTLLLDGTLIPVHDQSVTRPSKNYRRSVNIR